MYSDLRRIVPAGLLAATLMYSSCATSRMYAQNPHPQSLENVAQTAPIASSQQAVRKHVTHDRITVKEMLQDVAEFLDKGPTKAIKFTKNYVNTNLSKVSKYLTIEEQEKIGIPGLREPTTIIFCLKKKF